MSYGAFVHAAAGDRDAAARQRAALEAAREDRYRRAYAAARQHLPDVTDGRPGRPCPWVVTAILQLWGEHGEGGASVAAVRRRRRAILDAHRERWGHDPTSSLPPPAPSDKADGGPGSMTGRADVASDRGTVYGPQ